MDGIKLYLMFHRKAAECKMMKKSALLLLFGLLLCCGCSDDDGDYNTVVTIQPDPVMVPCGLPDAFMRMETGFKGVDHTGKAFYFRGIRDFDYEEGYEYVVSIHVTPAQVFESGDMMSETYTLNRIISKTYVGISDEGTYEVTYRATLTCEQYIPYLDVVNVDTGEKDRFLLGEIDGFDAEAHTFPCTLRVRIYPNIKLTQSFTGHTCLYRLVSVEE